MSIHQQSPRRPGQGQGGEQGKSKWKGLGSNDNHRDREESRGYGEKHSFGYTAGVGWRTRPCPNDANEQTTQAPL